MNHTHPFAALAALIAAVTTGAQTASVAARAEELPVRKAGRWELTTIAAAIGMRTVDVCIGPDDAIVSGVGEPGCSPPKVRRTGEEVIVDIVCKSKNGEQTTSTLFTGDFTTWYRATSKMTFDPPTPGGASMGVTIDAKYKGTECPPEAKEAPRASNGAGAAK
jgi:hypothetical protein